MDERELLTRAQAGDREALSRLLEAHQRVCYAFALRLTRSHPQDAEDVCQDAFARAARDVAACRSAESFRSWLLSLVRHAHGDRRDSERARRRREEAHAMERGSTTPAATSDERHELRTQLESALSHLDDRYRLPISLHYEQGLSYSEAAAALSVPEGTVATNIRRGLDELREKLSRVGYGALAVPAIIAAISQAPTIEVPATLAAFTKSLAAGGALKTAASVSAKLAAHKAVGLALGWKIAVALGVVGAVAAAVAVAERGDSAPAPAVAATETPAPRKRPAPAADAVPPAPVVSAPKPAAEAASFRRDFEDGKAHEGWTGTIEAGPERPGNRWCIAGQPVEFGVSRVRMADPVSLLTYREGAVLSFDYWVDEKSAAIDVYLWDRTQQASMGQYVTVLGPKTGAWTRTSVVLSDLKSDAGQRLADGDVIGEIVIQTSRDGGRLYIDNVDVTAAPKTRPETEQF